MKRLNDNAAALPAALITLTVLGAVLRWRVAGQDFFADELATYWIVSTNGLSGVVDTVSTIAEITPPLGFILAWLGGQIDLSPLAIRLPALIAGIGTIPLVYFVGARSVGRCAGLAAAAFVALSPFMIFYSAEARGYGVMMAFVLLSTFALLRAIDDDRGRWWIAYGAFVALAAYTHYTSIFVLGAQFAWALWAHPGARRPLLIATGVAALTYIPWLGGLKGDLDSPTTEILGSLSRFDLSSIKLYLGHWLLGYPYGNLATLRDLPGLAGGRRSRIAAAGLVAIGLGFGAVKMVTPDYERLNYSDVADFVADGPRGVVVDAAAFTPGPLANFDVESSDPGVPVFRLSIPDEKTEPFGIFDRLPDPAELADRVVAEADGAPITVVTTIDPNPIAGSRDGPALTREFIAGLPPSYRLVASPVFDGVLDLQALVFARPDSAPSG